MRNLLSNAYPQSKGKPNVTCDVQAMNGEFSLSDAKSCSECKKKLNRYPKGCNEEGLRVQTNNPLCVLRYDTYIQQFYSSDNVPSNCDYLLFDDDVDIRKIAFCDLTCSTLENVESNSGKYPEGKRAKCRTQMQISLDTLSQDSLLATRIYTIPHRLAIFGWREYRKGVDINRATSAMLGFGHTPSSVATILEYEPMALTGDFKFVEVRYPAVYTWTDPREDIATYKEWN